MMHHDNDKDEDREMRVRIIRKGTMALTCYCGGITELFGDKC